MNIERLKHLIHILGTVPDDRFDLEVWKHDDTEGTGCGTVACAVGWAGMDPEFNRQGFSLASSNLSFMPCFEHYQHFEAVAMFFDISTVQAVYLFDPDKYPNGYDTTKVEVMARVEGAIEAAS